jgi:hypothetical protein
LAGGIAEALEGIGYDAIDGDDFVIAKLFELAFAAFPGQRSAVLA